MPLSPGRRQLAPCPPGNPPPAEIKAARLRAGISQAAAARLVYKTTRAWELWEGGLRRMDPAFWELFLIRISEHAA
ncbi:XRE family transcriptional regulator [Ralstonia pickettii]|nr:XRE family transcriptional regulator [Ralstonia pickettii]MBA9852087.1 XRE family transcriptional regulator [Ralstonia pickettii]MBA9919898.1 XRE family transcriptional regulator [Ralstonia pickettii]MBA9959000.1 XRE family transcriptional regulator [Ralstonia pickettii]MBA9964621.1 XRE family transcriptional regulator [Ralstonia pickettii]